MGLPRLEVPKYELTVPSTKQEVTYRPYLVKEEKLLMLAMESKDEKQIIRVIKDVIKSCTEGLVDTNKITLFDMEYIFIKLRTKSVGELTTVGIKCESCGGKNDVSTNLDSVYVTIPENNNFIQLTPKIGMEMKYPSMMDAANIQTNEKLSDTDKLFDLVIACIDSIHSDGEIFDSSSHTKAELKEFIDSFNSDQFNKVRTFIESMPAASLDIEFTCIHCKEKNKMVVRGMQNFFN